MGSQPIVDGTDQLHQPPLKINLTALRMIEKQQNKLQRAILKMLMEPDVDLKAKAQVRADKLKSQLVKMLG